MLLRLRALLLVLGIALAAMARYVVSHQAQIAAQLGDFSPAARRFICLLSSRYPCPIGMAILVLAAASLLIAAAMRRDTTTPRPADNPAGPPRPIGWISALLGLCVAALAGYTGYWARADSGGAILVVAWLALLAAGFALIRLLDRTADTGSAAHRNAAHRAPPAHRAWLAALVAAQLLYTTHDIAHWRWSGTPDEAHFFEIARSIAEGRFSGDPLSERGVFGYHPVLSSYYQSWFMRLCGIGIFAWRLSSAVALAVALPFVYLLGRELWNVRTGLFAAALFGFAQLPVGFAHSGYNNVQAYPVVCAALAVLAWAAHRACAGGYYIAGCLAGLGFYTYYPARVTPLLLVILGTGLRALPVLRAGRARTLALALGFAAAALPALVHLPESVRASLRHGATLPPATAPSEGLLGRALDLLASDTTVHIAEHFGTALGHVMWAKGDHFQRNQLLDPISATLSTVALWLALGGAPWRRHARTLGVIYLVSVLLVGATSPYDWPPLTRLLFLAPFVALLAASALDQILPARRATWLGAAIVALAAGWNVAGTRGSVYGDYHGYGNGKSAEAVRILQTLPEDTHIVYVEGRARSMEAFDMIMGEYNMHRRFTYVRPFDLAKAAGTVRALPPPFVIFSELGEEPEILAELEQLMAERFPGTPWQESDPGKTWNQRYFVAPRR